LPDYFYVDIGGDVPALFVIGATAWVPEYPNKNNGFPSRRAFAVAWTAQKLASDDDDNSPGVDAESEPKRKQRMTTWDESYALLVQYHKKAWTCSCAY
jgi:hypothetical protein